VKIASYLAAILILFGVTTAESRCVYAVDATLPVLQRFVALEQPGISNGGRRVYTVGATPPVLQRFVAPSYPKEAAAAHYGGMVVARVVVDADGRVSDINIAGDTSMGIGHAVVDSVRKWSFTPALMDGKPVAVLIRIRLSFDGGTLEIAASLDHLSS
jgi:TonB family protein